MRPNFEYFQYSMMASFLGCSSKWLAVLTVSLGLQHNHSSLVLLCKHFDGFSNAQYLSGLKMAALSFLVLLNPKP